jgi:ParB family chromosome partitioning protein
VKLKLVTRRAKDLRPPRHARRSEAGDLDDLRGSIEKHGLLQPIVATTAGEVIAGDRRRQAVQKNGGEIPVLEMDVDELGALTLRLSEELSGREMNAIDKASGLFRLQELLERTRRRRVSAADVAHHIGAKEDTVRGLLRMVELPKPVQKLMQKGELGPDAGRALVAAKLEPEEKIGVARKMAAGTLPASGRKVREAVEFTEQADKDLREHIVRNPKVGLHEAKEYAKRKDRRELNARVEDLYAMRQRHFWLQVGMKWRAFATGIDGIRPLAGNVPESHRAGLRKDAEHIVRAVGRFIEAMEKAKPASEREMRRALEDAEIIDVEAKS